MFGVFKNLFSQEDNSLFKEAVNNDAFLVDVRTSQEFSSGSVKGAVNIPLDQVPNQLPKFKNRKTVVVFCRSGNRSAQAKMFLEQNGIENVINGGTLEDVEMALN